jgi:triosephosphate isomerase
MTPEARRPLVAGNWKMFKTRTETAQFCDALKGLLPDDRGCDVGICAPFTALDVAVERLAGGGIDVYAQNMHQAEEGAFTGEVSAGMLTDVGVQGVVLGHSERRQLCAETDRALKEKLPVALEAGLKPIFCVGETEEEREDAQTERKLRYQVQEGLERVGEDDIPRVVIAYEPIWAIGTGKVATPGQAQEAIAFIRALVSDRSKAAGEQVRIVYGGSVKPDNAEEILAEPDVDGALVGGASLDPEGFAQIAAAAG